MDPLLEPRHSPRALPRAGLWELGSGLSLRDMDPQVQKKHAFLLILREMHKTHAFCLFQGPGRALEARAQDVPWRLQDVPRRLQDVPRRFQSGSGSAEPSRAEPPAAGRPPPPVSIYTNSRSTASRGR